MELKQTLSVERKQSRAGGFHGHSSEGIPGDHGVQADAGAYGCLWLAHALERDTEGSKPM